MLTDATIEILKALKLYAMITAWVAQRAEPSMNDLHFDEARADRRGRDPRPRQQAAHEAPPRREAPHPERLHGGRRAEPEA